MINEKNCKKCNKPLPSDYKHKLCESCRNTKVAKVKQGLKSAIGVAGTVVCVVTVITTGKYKPKSKNSEV